MNSESSTTDGNFLGQAVLFGPVIAVALIVWLLPGKQTTSLTPRQQQLKEAVNRVLEPIGSGSEGRNCTSGFKSLVYYSCDVSDLQAPAIGMQLEKQGWTAIAPKDAELLRYSKPSMIAIVEPSRSNSRWLLTIRHSNT
jgi:hypothetical protein